MLAVNYEQGKAKSYSPQASHMRTVEMCGIPLFHSRINLDDPTLATLSNSTTTFVTLLSSPRYTPQNPPLIPGMPLGVVCRVTHDVIRGHWMRDDIRRDFLPTFLQLQVQPWFIFAIEILSEKKLEEKLQIADTRPHLFYVGLLKKYGLIFIMQYRRGIVNNIIVSTNANRELSIYVS